MKRVSGASQALYESPHRPQTQDHFRGMMFLLGSTIASQLVRTYVAYLFHKAGRPKADSETSDAMIRAWIMKMFGGGLNAIDLAAHESTFGQAISIAVEVQHRGLGERARIVPQDMIKSFLKRDFPHPDVFQAILSGREVFAADWWRGNHGLLDSNLAHKRWGKPNSEISPKQIAELTEKLARNMSPERVYDLEFWQLRGMASAGGLVSALSRRR